MDRLTSLYRPYNLITLITLLHQDLRNNYLYHPSYVAYDSSPENLMLNQSISPC